MPRARTYASKRSARAGAVWVQNGFTAFCLLGAQVHVIQQGVRLVELGHEVLRAVQVCAQLIADVVGPHEG